ncbi:hypothetical protein F5Y19DRAFT_488215 [Xylariaceae sp. FL1651]|nr:hypothetical protein F5Y19DRAFT_488215 [Xylariaceae sp. FL1651]
MADENGTLLARQVRRFIKAFPRSKSLENVEESAKTAILRLGNPDYHADQSEEILPIPLEFHTKRSFEAQYKMLIKEYPTLPDLKSEDRDKEKNKKEREKEKEDQEKEEREKKEKEEREKKEKEEREKKEKEEREKKEKEEREKKEKEEREKKEKEEREKKDKEEREKKEKEEREKKEKEEREKKDKEEREKKEKEEREKKEKEEREKKEKGEREKEKEEREKKEKEEREKKEKEEREKKEKEEREKKEKEEREKKEKEERKKKGGENSKSNLLDQLRSLPVEQIQDLIQDLGIASRESSVTPQGTNETSGRGFRGNSANTTSSWNTRVSSGDAASQTPGPWRKVRETLGDDTGYWLDNLSAISRDNDCDFADVKFYLEYLLRQDSDLTNSGLTNLAIEFINDCPGSQARFLKDLSENDPQLKRSYDRYYAPPRLLGETKEKRPWARNPQAYRDRLFESLPPDEEGWDQITLTLDPDTGRRNVKGRITASVAQFLDVCLKSLNNNDEERHCLALKSDYPQETRRFEDSERGQRLTIKPQPKGSLKGRLKTDIKILNYSCADQPYPDANPRMYFFGIDKKKKTIIRAWARTTYCETKEFKGGLDDLNDQRKACGQKEITTVSRIHRRWPNRDTGSNFDSNSDFDSDDELAHGDEQMNI